MIKEKVKRLKEECSWCGRKTLGQDEYGFICCVKCEYNSYLQRGKHKDMDYHEVIDRCWNIFQQLNCGDVIGGKLILCEGRCKKQEEKL